MKKDVWVRLRARLLLVTVAWPWAGAGLGVIAAFFDSEHTSIIYVILGLIVGVCGAGVDAVYTILQRNKSQISEVHWLWVGAGTALLSIPVFSLLMSPTPYSWETARYGVIFSATFGFLPAFAIAFALAKISRMRSNSVS